MSLRSLKYSNSGGENKSIKSNRFINQDGISLRSSKLSKTMPSKQIEPTYNPNKVSLDSLAHFSENNQQEKLSTEDGLTETISVGGYGWDGYEARFKDSATSVLSEYLTPKCIPPWAKSMRRKHNFKTSDIIHKGPTEKSSQMEEKFEQIMKKHKQLMLVKRIESKNQLVFEQNKYDSDKECLKMRTKSTKYYAVPLTASNERELKEDYYKRTSIVSDKQLEVDNSVYDSTSITHKKSISEEKKELFNVLETLKDDVIEKKNIIYKKDYKNKKDETKCPKITLNNIREYVENTQFMNPDEKKLHEIIKIESVPSGDIEDRRKRGLKYIINVPQSKSSEMTSVNVIKIKEKHKLRLHNMESADEHTTTLQYHQSPIKGEKVHEECFINTSGGITKKIKSPTETKTLEVTSKRSPKISHFIDKNKDTDKVLLIQYENKSTPRKKRGESLDVTKTQLFGVKESHSKDDTREMYLYDTETDGITVTENVAKVRDISPTLKDRVNLIFEELRGLAFKTTVEPCTSSEETKVPPTTESKMELLRMGTALKEEATVQAVPEVKSAEVQVRQSMLPGYGSDYLLRTKKSDKFSDTKTLEPESFTRQQYSKEKESFEIIEKSEGRQSQIEGIMEDEDVGLDEFKAKDIQSELSGSDIMGKQLLEKELADTEFGSKRSQLSPADVSTADILTADISTADISTADIIQSSSEMELSTTKLPSTKSDVESIFKDIDEKPSKSGLTSLEIETSKIELASSDQIIPERAPLKKQKGMDEDISLKDVGDMKEPREIIEDLSNLKKLSEMKTVDFSQVQSEDDTTDKDLKGLGDEDIRSYDLFPDQHYSRLKVAFSNKFLHGRKSLRRKMNWTETSIYLEENTYPQLVQALAETALQRPADPISFLAHWIYKDYHNKEINDQKEVWKEHLEIERTMEGFDKMSGKELKKFNLRKYPVLEEQTTDQDKDMIDENEIEQNESIQET